MNAVAGAAVAAAVAAACRIDKKTKPMEVEVENPSKLNRDRRRG